MKLEIENAKPAIPIKNPVPREIPEVPRPFKPAQPTPTFPKERPLPNTPAPKKPVPA